MTLESLRNKCLSLPFVTEDIKWGHHLCFSVGGKMFMITSPDEVPVNASVKVATEDFESLCERKGIIPAPYLARYYWIKIEDINLLSSDEWTKICSKAYNQVLRKLPKKERLKLEESSALKR